MINWKENKIVGIIAGIVLVITVAITIANIVKKKVEEQKILQKKNPPAVIERF